MEVQKIHDGAIRLKDYVINLRRAFHRCPELAGQEVETRALIQKELKSIGLTSEERDGNVYAILEGACPGKTVVLRADFDALPVVEESGVSYCSENHGVMHACGHDAHTAMLLSAARLLAEDRKNLHGTVIFLFQYGEEQGRGAVEALAYLKGIERIDGLLGIHVMSDIPTGEIMVRPGAVMAGGTGFQVEVTGRGGHSSSPWAAVDPIRPLCDILMRATSLAVNKFNVQTPFVICPCVLRGGEIANIIPEKASFQATLRIFQEETFSPLRQELIDISNSVAETYHAKAELLMGPLLVPVVNHQGMAERLRCLVPEVEGLALSDHPPFMLSDNFGMLLKEFPGVYCFLGVGNEDKESTYAHHHPKFQIDEDALPLGVEFLTRGAMELLAE